MVSQIFLHALYRVSSEPCRECQTMYILEIELFQFIEIIQTLICMVQVNNACCWVFFNMYST